MDVSEVARLAETVSQAVNLLPIIASPRLYERWRMQASPAELRQVLLECLSGLQQASETLRLAEGGGTGMSFERAGPQVRAFLEAVAATQAGEPLAPAWGEYARACLGAMGLPAPQGGWESFEGEW